MKVPVRAKRVSKKIKKVTPALVRERRIKLDSNKGEPRRYQIASNKGKKTINKRTKRRTQRGPIRYQMDSNKGEPRRYQIDSNKGQPRRYQIDSNKGQPMKITQNKGIPKATNIIEIHQKKETDNAK